MQETPTARSSASTRSGRLGAFVDGLVSRELRGAAAGRRGSVPELLAQLASHNAKEEPIIYRHGDAVLIDQAKAELHEFIDRPYAAGLGLRAASRG